MARFDYAVSAVALLAALSTSVPAWAQTVQSDYVYDVHGRLTNVTRPGSATAYTYDKAQNRTDIATTVSGNSQVAAASKVSPLAASANDSGGTSRSGGADAFASVASTGSSDSAPLGDASVAAPTASASSTIATSPPSPSNRAPTAVDETVDRVQDTTTGLTPLANDTDPDNDTLTLTKISALEFVSGTGKAADLGATSQLGDTVIYHAPRLTSARGTFILVRFRYWISDGHGGASSAFQTVKVSSAP